MGDAEVENLLKRAASGDRAAAGELAHRYTDPVRAIVRRRLGPELRARVDTDDVFQSTFAAALDDIPGVTYRGERAFVAWLATVAERRILLAARRHRAAKRDLRKEEPLRHASELPGARTSPSEGAVRGEMTEWLRAAVERLPPLEREVVMLHSFEGADFPEVARRLKLSDKNAARRVFQRALKQMGELLPSTGEGEGSRS